jgi:hypothetical protein
MPCAGARSEEEGYVTRFLLDETEVVPFGFFVLPALGQRARPLEGVAPGPSQLPGH